MTRKIEINLGFTENEFTSGSNCSISIAVNGEDQDIISMNDELKLQCISVMRQWADILEEEIYK